ncbi:MAG: hypothetical protein HRU09_14530 [Oligoflexales bacterium]|nr:hypothetical protein [Oligoflexales bacterium]
MKCNPNLLVKFMVAACAAFIVQGLASATEFAAVRSAGDERKFEATQVIWRTWDNYSTSLEPGKTPAEERIYLRSGSVIGMREFMDQSTMTFELATGSRFGHVAIAISAADAVEVLLRFIERGGLPEFEHHYQRVNFESDILRSDLVVSDIEKAYETYIEFGKQYGWKRTLNGQEFGFHPLKTKTVYRPLAKLIRELYSYRSVRHWSRSIDAL